MPEMLLERRISDRAFVGHYVAGAVVGFIIAIVCFMTAMWPLIPLALVPVAGVFVYARLMRAATIYRLYSDRLEVETGILARKIENVELFRVRDVGLRQGLFGRMADFGDIYVHSTDSSTPDVHVRAIDGPKEFYQHVRQVVSESRAQHRTMIVEEGRPMLEE
jgi:membrane protein YdbS with pleckstrin-like domain